MKGSDLPTKEQEPVMRLLERGAATAIATVVSFSVNAADLGYPPPLCLKSSLPSYRE